MSGPCVQLLSFVGGVYRFFIVLWVFIVCSLVIKTVMALHNVMPFYYLLLTIWICSECYLTSGGTWLLKSLNLTEISV